MDSSVILPIIAAIIAIVPGVWALINQANKDKAQGKIDSMNLAQNAALGIITPLREEVARLQLRITELEAESAERNKRIAELEQQLFDKDSTIRKLQYSLEGMKLRLEAVENNGKEQPKTE